MLTRARDWADETWPLTARLVTCEINTSMCHTLCWIANSLALRSVVVEGTRHDAIVHQQNWQLH